MRESPGLRHIPVVVVTAGDLSADQRAELTDFGHRLVTKSALTEAELFETIQRALHRVRRTA
jgi:CheY-like chemotaxis protein